jgi:hypothetical protein
MVTWVINFSFTVIDTFVTSVVTWFTFGDHVEVVSVFTWTFWWFNSVDIRTGKTVIWGTFTSSTLEFAVESVGGTDSNFFDFDGVGGWFWLDTEWWLDESFNTFDTVIGGLDTRFTFLVTSWTVSLEIDVIISVWAGTERNMNSVFGTNGTGFFGTFTSITFIRTFWT